MTITELTPQQLRQAASIKEEIDALNRELRNLLDGASSNGTASTMSAAARRKIGGCVTGEVGEAQKIRFLVFLVIKKGAGLTKRPFA